MQVEKVEEQGAYVQLLEYNNVEGMILSSELSRRRIRSVAKILRVGTVGAGVIMCRPSLGLCGYWVAHVFSMEYVGSSFLDQGDTLKRVNTRV